MYGVIIEKGPKNWQILQQKDGFATVEVEGRIELEESTWTDYNDQRVMVRVTDENTNARVIEPVIVKPLDRRFKATVLIPAGGPYRLEVYFRFNGNWERRGDRVFHLGVGDVYLIAGQSNAVGVGKDIINDPISTDVHAFKLSGNWDIATHPLSDSTDGIFPELEEGCQSGISPWLIFGKILAKKLGHPIGLIPTAKGGVPLAFWNREEDGRCFNAMLEVVNAAKTDIKGIVWSQGCNDAEDRNENTRTTYLDRFKALCKDFEDVFYKGIPIITVQLNKIVCTKCVDSLDRVGKGLSSVRESQRQAAKQIDNVYVVPSIDLMVCDGIHNSGMSTMVIGERVANIALKYVYGKTAVSDAPDIEKAVVEDKNKVRLYFNNVNDCLYGELVPVDILMFSVTDDKGRILPCDYDCPSDNSIILIFDRDICDNATVSCDGYNDTGRMVFDIYNYMPILPFDGVKVER